MIQTLWKTVWQFLTKLIILLPYDPAIIFLLKGTEYLCPHKNLHTGVYRNFIHNC